MPNDRWILYEGRLEKKNSSLSKTGMRPLAWFKERQPKMFQEIDLSLCVNPK